MTVIYRRAMLRVMLGGAVVATRGISHAAGCSRIRATRDEQKSSCADRKPRRGGGRRCASPTSKGVLVAPGTSHLPLALSLKARRQRRQSWESRHRGWTAELKKGEESWWSKAEQHSDERQRQGDGLAAFPRGRPQSRYSTLSRLADCLP
jgi:hypothetical protein